MLFGCITIGGVALGIHLFINNSENTKRNVIENIINDIENTTDNNSSRNILTNNVKNTNTNVNTNNSNSTINKTNTANNIVNNNTANNLTNSSVNNKTSNSLAVSDAKTSTKETPLEKGAWGIASKYSTETKNYEDVYIKVTNVIRGEDAKKAVQDYCNSKTYIKYEEPKEGLEWVVLDYDLDFGNYTKSSLGASADVSVSIKGVGNNNSVKYNGVTYIITSRYIGSSDYVKTQEAKGKIAFQMPIGCKDYIVQFGAYNNTNAYFKCE